MPRKILRKPAKKETPEELEKDFESKELIQEEEKKPFKLSRKHLSLIGIAFILGILYSSKGLFVAAVVNGQPIPRISVINELEKQGGKRTLESIIVKTLIFQEAQKQKVKIEQKEIDSEINKIKDQLEKQGQTLDQALSLQGLIQQDMVEQITLQKMIEKMVGKDIKVTDKEVNDFIEENKDAFPQNVSSEEIKKQSAQQIKQQKLGEKAQTFIADIQKKAKILYFVSY